MSNFSAFLAQNKVKKENVKFAVSDSFLDENGKPIEWELRQIDSSEDKALRKAATQQVKVPGRSNQYRAELDTNMYISKLVTACVVFPNLNDKELQDSYKVMGAENLIEKMLSPGEFAELSAKVTEINGFDVGLNEAVETAKN